MKMRVFMGTLLASAIVATPAAAASKRKTLFEVLFPRAHQERVERRKRFEQSQRDLQLKNRKVVKVQSSKNYAYRVAKRAPIVLTALPVEYASADPASVIGPVPSREVSKMTSDILTATDLALRAEEYLAKAVSEFYKTNQKYHWIDENGDWTDRALMVREVLGSAETYGLRSSDYKVDTEAFPVDASDEELSRLRINREVSMTTAVLRYVMDAKFGTINANRLSGYHDFPVHYGKSSDVLDEIMNSSILLHTLQSAHPSNEKFQALKRELADLQNVQDDIIELNPKTFLKPGRSHPELPNIVAAINKRASASLRDEFSETFDWYYGEVRYTKDLVKLVKAYQKEAGLGPDGIIGPNTISKLAGLPSENKIMKIKLAMERLRWHPHDLGQRHVFINQPEYRARYIEDGKENLSMRVVVGKKSNQTNFFYDEIEKVVYNPYWGVPRSIIVNEFLPKSLGNPGYLDQRGYEIQRYNGKRISSSSIDWYNVGANPNFSVRQKPGPKNALGKVKILFPNKHAIYMHDTPAKSLFKRENRAFSHGCVRLHDPQAMAAAVLGTSKSYINSRIKPGKNQTEHLSVKVPVYVSYFTAWPQENGEIKYFRDMYGRDAHLMKAFKATEKARATSISS